MGFSGVNYLLVLLLLPAFLQGTWTYGLFAVRVVAASVFFCTFFDILLEKTLRGKPRTCDGSAILAGMLMGMLFPPLTPWWVTATASGAGMFLGKHLFGGAGGCPFNAVCIGWAVVMVSWPGMVEPTYGSILFELPFNSEFPLAVLRRLGSGATDMFPLKELLCGSQAGGVGTGATLPLLAGGCLAVAFRIVPPLLPISFFCAVGCTAALLSGSPATSLSLALFHSFTGFSMIGAFFVAADFSSRPVSMQVTIWYGIAIGVLTVLFRTWSAYPEALPFAVLVVNMTIPLLDRGTAPKKIPVEVVRI